jgi:hypothetical protein
VEVDCRQKRNSFQYFVPRYLLSEVREKDITPQGLVRVCTQAFQFVHQLARADLEYIQAQFKEPQWQDLEKLTVVQRKHKNVGREPVNKITTKNIQFFLGFINFLKEHICMPYAGYDDRDERADPTGNLVYMLPPWFTFKILHQLYNSIAEHYHEQKLGKTKFRELWRKHVKLIDFAGRKTAACDDCVLFKRGKATLTQKLENAVHRAHMHTRCARLLVIG